MEKREYIQAVLDPSLDDLKAHVRVTSDDLDGTLMQSLKAAVRSAEHHIGQVIALSKFTYTGAFARALPLRVPVLEILAVAVDGVEVPSESFTVAGGVLTFAEDVTGAAVEVTYKAGMCPPVEFDIRAAILLIASKLFMNPADRVETLVSKSSILLRPYRGGGK